MVKHRPEMFAAFVGTGQIVNGRQNELYNYRRHVQRARQLGALDILAVLEEIAPPPHTDWERLRRIYEWANRTADGDGDSC